MEITPSNEKSLQELAWEIDNSQGQFKLILAHCNYANLRQKIARQLHKICGGVIQELTLDQSVHKLYTTIQENFSHETPYALMVFGLESVFDIDQVLVGVNPVREEFRKHCRFPLVLWVNNEIVQKLIRLAPDLESWTSFTEFIISDEDLRTFIKQTANQVFTKVLEAGSGIFLDNAALNLGLGSPQRAELESAHKEMQNRGIKLEPELEASLEFVLGRDAEMTLEQSRRHYERSLELFQQQEQTLTPFENPQLLERRGCLLYCLGLWWATYAVRHRNEQEAAYVQAKAYLQQCIAIFEQVGRDDLVAKFINSLGEVLKRLEHWNELELVAKKAYALHQLYPDSFRRARSYGFSAEVALAKSAWMEAQQYAQKALSMVAIACSIPSISSIQNTLEFNAKLDLECSFHQGWYLYSLARTQLALNQMTEALVTLETAKAKAKPQYDPHLYILILSQLQQSYFQQREYLKAFNIKQEQRSIEQQYGFRAFIGAARLQPKQQVTNPALPQIEQQITIAPEIAASGRGEDVNQLIERIGRDDHSLTIIYGPSGVGKSSILQAGLIPALKQHALGTRDVLPVLQQVYAEDWVQEFAKSLTKAMAELVNPGESLQDLNSEASILKTLEELSENHLKIVLIFDQFEEFFVEAKTSKVRQAFHHFLQHCLEISCLNIILAIREDYIHYLLECNRLGGLDVINNNILDKNILKYLGNFLPEEAKFVIQRITEQTQFPLEPNLIDELVKDLAGEEAAVSPVELQVVGAQILTEKIRTLEQYRQNGNKEKLVNRFLDEVIQSCGPENEQIAKLVLYFLTHENNTRPLKTQAELATDLAVESQQLDLVLEIFVQSGLVLWVPQYPAHLYQLVHDYLVSFIRQQQDAERLAQLEKDKEQLRLTEEELKRVEQANQILVQAQNEANLTIRRGVIGVTAFAIAAILLVIWGSREILDTKRKEQFKQLQLESFGLQFAPRLGEIEKLQSAIKIGKKLKDFVGNDLLLKEYPTTSPILALQTILDNIHEQKRFDNQSRVYGISLSANGKYVATTGEDGAARVWNLSGKSLVQMIGHQGETYGVSFSPDSKTIATTGEDGTIRLWNLSGQQLVKITGHQGRVYDVNFSPDGKYLASAGKDGSVRLWDTSGQLLATLQGHLGQVNSVSFSPDGQRLATAGNDGNVRLWSVSGRLLKQLSGHSGKVLGVSFSNDGTLLASAGEEGIVRLWNQEGDAINQFQAHQALITGVNFSPDSKFLITISTDGTGRLWNTSGKQIALFSGHLDWIYDVSFSSDSKLIATAGRDGTIRLWNIFSRQQVQWKVEAENGRSVSFSPDGLKLATAGDEGIARLWNLSGQKLAECVGHQGWIYAVSFSPDGKRLATAGEDGTARLWDLSGRQLAQLNGHQHRVYSINFSPDGKQLVTAGEDGSVRLWEASGKLIQVLHGHQGRVYSAVFSPDRQHLATADESGLIKVWSVFGQPLHQWKTNRDPSSPQSYQDTRIYSVSFSPDGKQLASAGEDGTARLWDVSGRLLKEWKTNPGRVDSISFSPDGQLIATAGVDGKIRLWSLSGEPVAEYNGHQGAAINLSFKRNGQQLASVGNDGFLRLWQVENLDQLLVQGCRWLKESIATDGETQKICP